MPQYCFLKEASDIRQAHRTKVSILYIIVIIIHSKTFDATIGLKYHLVDIVASPFCVVSAPAILIVKFDVVIFRCDSKSQ